MVVEKLASLTNKFDIIRKNIFACQFSIHNTSLFMRS